MIISQIHAIIHTVVKQRHDDVEVSLHYCVPLTKFLVDEILLIIYSSKGLIVMPKWTKTKALAIRIQCISLKVRKRMEAKTNIHCGWILSCIWFTRTKKFATCYFPIIFLIGTFVIWPTLIFWVLLMGSIISQLLCFFFFINFTNTTFNMFSFP